MTEAHGGSEHATQRVVQDLAYGETLLLNEVKGESLVGAAELAGHTGVDGARVVDIVHAGGRLFYVAQVETGASFTEANGRYAVDPGLFVLGADGLNGRGNTAGHRIRPGESVVLDSHAAAGFDTFFGGPEGRPNVALEFYLDANGQLTLINHAEDPVAVESRRAKEHPAQSVATVGGAAVAMLVNEPQPQTPAPPEHGGAEVAELEPTTPEEKRKPSTHEIFRDSASILETLADDTVDEEVKRELRDVLQVWDELCQAREVNRAWGEVAAKRLDDLEAALPDAERGVNQAAARISSLRDALAEYIGNNQFTEIENVVATGMDLMTPTEIKEALLAAGEAVVQEGRRLEADLHRAEFLKPITDIARDSVGADGENYASMLQAVNGHGDPENYSAAQLDALCNQATSSGDTMPVIANGLRVALQSEPNVKAWPARQQVLQSLIRIVSQADGSGRGTVGQIATQLGGYITQIEGLITTERLTTGSPDAYHKAMRQFETATNAIGQFADEGELAALQRMFANLKIETEAAHPAAA